MECSEGESRCETQPQASRVETGPFLCPRAPASLQDWRHQDSPFEVGLMDSLEKVGRPDLSAWGCGTLCAVSEWELYILPVGKKRKQCWGGSIPGGGLAGRWLLALILPAPGLLQLALIGTANSLSPFMLGTPTSPTLETLPHPIFQWHQQKLWVWIHRPRSHVQPKSSVHTVS